MILPKAFWGNGDWSLGLPITLELKKLKFQVPYFYESPPRPCAYFCVNNMIFFFLKRAAKISQAWDPTTPGSVLPIGLLSPDDFHF